MDSRFRTLIGLFTVLNAVLVLFTLGMVMALRADVQQLAVSTPTRDDLVAMNTTDVQLFHEQACTSCHTERRFAGPHFGTQQQISAAIAHMQTMPDVDLAEAEVTDVRASLTALQCAQCHTLDRAGEMALKTPDEQLAVIARMARQPGSSLDPDDASQIRWALMHTLGR